MKPITLNRKITLQKRERQYGHSMNDTVTAKAVWASVSLPSMTARNNAMSAGYGMDLVVHCLRSEYESFNADYVVVDNVQYRVTSVTTSLNDLYIKLALTRG